MKKIVLDAYAVMAYAEGEPGAEAVASLFKQALDGHVQLYMCVINWGEVYYMALREGGVERAELYRNTISHYPISLVAADEALTFAAARIKASNKISYADAFAAALAVQLQAELVTGDPEFKPLQGSIKILWIG